MKCETMGELLKEAKQEISFAIVLNPDRVKAIKESVEEVIAEKFSKEGDEKKEYAVEQPCNLMGFCPWCDAKTDGGEKYVLSNNIEKDI